MTDLQKKTAYIRILTVTLMIAFGCLAACQPVINVQPAVPSPTIGPSPSSLPTPSPTTGLTINSFEDCIAGGFPVMESYPRQCRAGDETLFVEDIGNELEKIDLIRLDSPRPNQGIQSPLGISGEARGFWYFEADFPIRLLDEAGNEIAITIAQAQGDWMTEEFVPFKATLTFSAPPGTRGTLVLEKDNPSGLPENADALIVPVIVE
jgi:hypothetical protein